MVFPVISTSIAKLRRFERPLPVLGLGHETLTAVCIFWEFDLPSSKVLLPPRYIELAAGGGDRLRAWKRPHEVHDQIMKVT